MKSPDDTSDISQLTYIPISEIWAAKERIKDVVSTTPLVPLNIDQTNLDSKVRDRS
jgi:hypothetical protein